MNLTIDGMEIIAEPGTTILQAARSAGIDIPTLCQDDRLEPIGACRLCLVEVAGTPTPVVSCGTEVREGMNITTSTPEIDENRRMLIDLLLSDHRMDCLVCDQSGGCRLQEMAYRFGVGTTTYAGAMRPYEPREDTPFIAYDPGKCILCGLCVAMCQQVQGCHVLDFTGRSFDSLISTSFERSMLETACEMCGNCVSACPTGALQDKLSRHCGRTWDVERVNTVCVYCGCGCTIQLHVKDDRIVQITSRVGEGPGEGNLCVKGRYGYQFVGHPDRLTQPLIRRAGELVPATWDEALGVVAERLGAIRSEYGPDALAGFSSAKCTNEENYLFQKFMRAVIGTQNVDHCARLCHASTVSGLRQSLGSGAMTNSFEDLEEAEVIFIIGSNTSEAHPIGAIHIKKALRNGAKLIVADPRAIDMAQRSDVHLQLRSGTNVAVVNGMMHVILNEGLANDEFIADRTESFEEMAAVLAAYTPELVQEISGVPADKLREAARLFGTAGRAAIIYSMGITQHSHGTEHVIALSNLALLTGNIGRRGTGVNPLRGQNNVQGACDMGALPNVYTGYQPVGDPAAQEKFSQAWGAVELPDKPGLTVTEVFDEIAAGSVRGLYVVGENPMLSDPDQTHVEEALRQLEFLVVQDLFLSETAVLANVVLPAASFAEKDGTFTNTERKVQRIRRAVAPPGEAKSDWEIVADLARHMGAQEGWDYTHASDIMDEIARVTPSYAGITFDRLDEGGLCWPCPDTSHPGTPILHIGSFTRGKGKFFPISYQAPAEEPDEEYPFTLTTGRMLEHYHTGTLTRRSDGLNELVPGGSAEMNPGDAVHLAVADGVVVTVETRRGSIRIPANVTDRVRLGTIFIPFHFWETPANRLTNPARDPIANIPEFKVCACRITT